METGEQIEQNGWRQGSFLPAALAPQARTFGGELVQAKVDELFMAVSQSCDLVHGKFENEPWCEVLRLSRIEKLDSRFSHGRNSRILDFEVSQQGLLQCVRATAHERCFLPRELLANSCPETSIECPSAELRVVRDWLGKRYTRPALPTAFNQIILGDKSVRKDIEKLLDRSHHTVSDMFLWLDPFDEIPRDARYTVRVLLVSPVEVLENPEGKTAAEAFRRKLEELLSRIPRLQVEAVILQADNRTSLRQIGEYVIWDFDFLTVRDESEGAHKV